MRILILSARLPYPHNTGAKIRAFQLMKVLASQHQVTLLTFYGSPQEERYFQTIVELGIRLVPILNKNIDVSVGLREIMHGMISGLPLTVIKYHDKRMATAFEELLPHHDVLHCEHMHMAQYLTDVHDKLKVLDAHNVEAQIAERLVHIESNPFKRAVLAWNHRAMRRYEKRICTTFDLTLAVSMQDRDCYLHEYLAKNAQILENGVDLDYFHTAPSGITTRLKLVFVGMMGWMPNSDGIKYFVSEILPRIRNEFPGIEVDFVGKDPPEDIVKLSDMPGIRVTGTVDDVRPYVWDAQVYIVPLRFGGGTRLKILEAFAMHKPVVSTSLGCEGIECRNGKELLIADLPSDFADAVIRLLLNSALREDLGSNAAQLVKMHYGWKSLGEKMLRYYEDLAAGNQQLNNDFIGTVN